MQSKDARVFRSSEAKYLLLHILFSLILGSIPYLAFKNLTVSLLFTLGLISVFAFYFLLTWKTITVVEDGLLFKSILSEEKVNWTEITSMSTIYNVFSFLKYQIKTRDKSVSMFPPKEWKKFENLIEEKVGLELWGRNQAVLVVKGPGIKRWNKKGQAYTNTGFIDKVFGLGYLEKGDTTKKKKLGLFFFVLGAIGVLIGLLFELLA